MTYEQRILSVGNLINRQLELMASTDDVAAIHERIQLLCDIGVMLRTFVNEGQECDIFTIPSGSVIARPRAAAPETTKQEAEPTPEADESVRKPTEEPRTAAPEPVKEEPKAQPVTETPANTAAAYPDRTEVRRKLVLAQKNGVDVKALIASFGANKLSDVKDSDLAELLEKAGV